MYFVRFLIWILHVLIHHVLVDITAQKKVWPIVDISYLEGLKRNRKGQNTKEALGEIDMSHSRLPSLLWEALFLARLNMMN